MAVEQTRYRNGLKLVEEAGSFVEFGKRVDMDRPQVSNLLGRHPVRNIGHKLARRFEAAFGRPDGWLDVEHDRGLPADVWTIQAIDLAASVKPGTRVLHEDSIISIGVSPSMMRSLAGRVDSRFVQLTTMRGDAMAQSLPDGSTLLVDRSATTVLADGVYVLLRGGDLFVRRVQRAIDGGYIIRCDNSAYEPTKVQELSGAGIQVLGRAVSVIAVRPV